MDRPDIRLRLEAGERLLLDGGTGSELQRRGVNLTKGMSVDGDLGAWSATAIGDAPEVVRAAHEDYLREGADIVTTNSFWTSRSRLDLAGLGDRAEEYTRRSAELAVEARDTINPEAYVAGSVSPVDFEHPIHQGPASAELIKEFTDQATVLAESGVDLILLEYVGYVSDCVATVNAVSSIGLPVFLGVRWGRRHEITPEGTMQYGETAEELAAALSGHRVDAILAMCCPPETISAALPKLREAFDGAIGGYANIGYRRAPDRASNPGQQYHGIDIGDFTPERYARFGQQWLDMGAQIVGGCCATGPEHTNAMRPMVRSS